MRSARIKTLGTRPGPGPGARRPPRGPPSTCGSITTRRGPTARRTATTTSRYYYQPVVTYTTYEYHYCIYYPSQPSYIYYYNPTTQVYWGRYEIGSKGDKRYSMLDPKDRKKDLKEIPESAFPEPAAMPTIPGASDDVAMEPPPENVPKEKK